MNDAQTYRAAHFGGPYVALCPDGVVRHRGTFPSLTAAHDHAEACCMGRHRIVRPVALVGGLAPSEPATTAIARVGGTDG